MNLAEFHQAVAKIMCVKGKVLSAAITQSVITGKLLVTFQIEVTPTQKKKLLDFILSISGISKGDEK